MQPLTGESRQLRAANDVDVQRPKPATRVISLAGLESHVFGHVQATGSAILRGSGVRSPILRTHVGEFVRSVESHEKIAGPLTVLLSSPLTSNSQERCGRVLTFRVHRNRIGYGVVDRSPPPDEHSIGSRRFVVSNPASGAPWSADPAGVGGGEDPYSRRRALQNFSRSLASTTRFQAHAATAARRQKWRGGVVGDTAGSRPRHTGGITLVHVPPRAAQVESSIGGMFGVTTRWARLIGAFHHLRYVAIDLALATRPRRSSARSVRVVKYGMIATATVRRIAGPKAIFARDPEVWSGDRRVCRIKATWGRRRARRRLRRSQLRPTVGHALEAVTKYRACHGEAMTTHAGGRTSRARGALADPNARRWRAHREAGPLLTVATSLSRRSWTHRRDKIRTRQATS